MVDTSTDKQTPWLECVRTRVEAHHNRGGFLIVFPDYRPDLIKQMAHGLGLEFIDIRAELMAPLGWEAHSLALAAVDNLLRQRTTETGVVAHNSEALLATKTRHERETWLQAVVADDRPHPLLVPITLFATEIASSSTDRICVLEPEHLSEQTLISRLIL
jgi:hypothetical protein